MRNEKECSSNQAHPGPGAYMTVGRPFLKKIRKYINTKLGVGLGRNQGLSFISLVVNLPLGQTNMA